MTKIFKRHEMGADTSSKKNAREATLQRMAAELKAHQKTKAAPSEVLDLLASHEGSHKRAVVKVLLKGKTMTVAKLANAVYGKPEFTHQINMVLRGIAKAIKDHKLALTLVKADGSVTLK